MSYSCSDFASDCAQNADAYQVPRVLARELPDCHPKIDDGDALRILAERVARAMCDRDELRNVLAAVLGVLAAHNFRGNRGAEADVIRKAHKTLAETGWGRP